MLLEKKDFLNMVDPHRQNEFKKMKAGEYEVRIDSNFKKGNLEIAHAKLEGKIKREIMFSSYICHPSMANNELSGPVLLNSILRFIRLNFKRTFYSYRFVLCPETIGSIAYLSRYLKELRKNVIAGYVLSCVGDGRQYSQVTSLTNNNLADISLRSALIGKKKRELITVTTPSGEKNFEITEIKYI